MKTLIIALLISSVVSGQKPASQTVPIDFFMQPYKAISIGNYKDFRGNISYMVKDTLPTTITTNPPTNGYFIMRPADTLKPLPKDTTRTLFLVTDTSLAKTNYQVFAIKGFRVIENGYGYDKNMNPSPMNYLISYLDSNKKPLPNTWVVWQTSIY